MFTKEDKHSVGPSQPDMRGQPSWLVNFCKSVKIKLGIRGRTGVRLNHLTGISSMYPAWFRAFISCLALIDVHLCMGSSNG